MENYIVKFVYGKESEKIKTSRTIHIDGLDLEEFEQAIELIALNVLKKALTAIKSNNIDIPVVNYFIYDGEGHFLFKKEINILDEKLEKDRFNKKMHKTLKYFY